MPLSLLRPGLLRDPLLERDYLRICSRPAAFRNRALGALVAGTVVLFVIGAARGREQPDVLGQRVHLVFCWLAAFYTAGIALGEASTAIPVERSRSTLPLLLASPLRHRRMAAGFLLSRILAAFTSLIALLPIEGVALLLGGVSLEDLLRGGAAIAVCGVYAASAGLLGGHAAPDTRRGLARGGSAAFIPSCVLPLVLLIAYEIASDGSFPGASGVSWSAALFNAALTAAWAASPLCSLVALSGPRVPSLMGILPIAVPAAVALGLSAAAILLAGRRLRMEAESEIVRARAAGASAATAPSGDRVGRRALWWRESRPPRGALARWGFRLGTLLWAGFLFWTLLDTRLHAPPSAIFTPHDFLVSIPLWLLLFGGMAGAGTFIAEMREKGTLETLRTTPLGPADYLLARPIGNLRRLLPALAATALFAVAGIAMGLVHPATVPCWILGFGLSGPVLLLLAAYAGAAAPGAQAAARRVGFLLAVFLIVLPLAVLVVAMFGLGDTSKWLLAFNPLVALSGPIQAMALAYDGNLGWNHRSILPLFSCAACLPCAGAAIGLWHLRHRVLDRAFHGREG